MHFFDREGEGKGRTSCKSLLATIAVQRANESCSLLTVGSSSSCSSKHEIGTRKMIEVRSSKYGNQACLCIAHQVSICDLLQ